MTTLPATRFSITIDGERARIGTADELSIALDVLQGARDRDVLTQLRPHLASIITGPAGFLSVMKSLSPDDQVLVIDGLGPALANVLGEVRHLRDLLATLAAPSVERALLLTLGTTGLRSLIGSAAELAQVLEWIYGHNDVELVSLLGDDYVRGIIRSGSDLALVLNALEPAGQADLVQLLGWTRIAALVTSSRDLAYLLRALPAADSLPLIERFSRESLVALIGNARDWQYLYDRLEPAEARAVLRILGASPDAA